MTGLAAGIASGLPVYEADETPGGICSSYYVRPGEADRLHVAPGDGGAYRFEIGGGHWIFGGDAAVMRFISDLAPVKRYTRRSAVYFHERDFYVPYPLQDNLRYMPRELAAKALVEMASPPGPFKTMKEWQLEYFGPTLCETFFLRFHELYTAGLHERIAPQDAYKSPVNLSAAIQGAFEETAPVGYNITYAYPMEGLNTLAQRMAARCEIHYGKRAARIDVNRKIVHFADGSEDGFDVVISTLPLNSVLTMTGLSVDAEPDPYSSVLVLNIGARKGPRCPSDHWYYNPDARSGFHRVGFYSNVDRSFMPASDRENESSVSIYVERAYPGGTNPGAGEVDTYCDDVVEELQDWGYIGKAEVVDPTWIDVAYTWAWPGSTWRAQALRLLEEHSVYMVGRYARWMFQGLADSIRDGLLTGACFRKR